MVGESGDGFRHQAESPDKLPIDVREPLEVLDLLDGFRRRPDGA